MNGRTRVRDRDGRVQVEWWSSVRPEQRCDWGSVQRWDATRLPRSLSIDLCTAREMMQPQPQHCELGHSAHVLLKPVSLLFVSFLLHPLAFLDSCHLHFLHSSAASLHFLPCMTSLAHWAPLCFICTSLLATFSPDDSILALEALHVGV